MPCTRSLGVERDLPSSMRPVFSSKAATSVKVPPMSAARRVRAGVLVLDRVLKRGTPRNIEAGPVPARRPGIIVAFLRPSRQTVYDKNTRLVAIPGGRFVWER